MTPSKVRSWVIATTSDVQACESLPLALWEWFIFVSADPRTDVLMVEASISELGSHLHSSYSCLFANTPLWWLSVQCVQTVEKRKWKWEWKEERLLQRWLSYRRIVFTHHGTMPQVRKDKTPFRPGYSWYSVHLRTTLKIEATTKRKNQNCRKFEPVASEIITPSMHGPTYAVRSRR